MGELDENEVKIVRELIRNPRISDNQIAKKTKIPVMTVNRKRKKLEKQNLLRYYTSLDTGADGTGVFVAKQMYIIKFKIGITRNEYLKKVEFSNELKHFSSSYMSLSYLGEKDGHLALILILDAKTESNALDIIHKALASDLTSGKSPISISATALYLSALINKNRKTQKLVAETADITEATLRARAQELITELKLKVKIKD